MMKRKSRVDWFEVSLHCGLKEISQRNVLCPISPLTRITNFLLYTVLSRIINSRFLNYLKEELFCSPLLLLGGQETS